MKCRPFAGSGIGAIGVAGDTIDDLAGNYARRGMRTQNHRANLGRFELLQRAASSLSVNGDMPRSDILSTRSCN
jgi:hypothetical protein